MKKRLVAVILALVMALSAAVTAFAGVWQYDEGYWYFSDETVTGDEDESLTGWQWIDGYCYYFDPDEYGAMAVSTVTPDGFPVDEYGRMTNSLGVPYYIEGWGLEATNPGPEDYEYYLENDYYDWPENYALSHYIDLDILSDMRRRRDRDHNDPGRRTPDTIFIQILLGGQTDMDEESSEGADEADEGIVEEAQTATGLPELPEADTQTEEQSGNIIMQPEKEEQSGNITAQPEKRGQSGRAAGQTEKKEQSGNTAGQSETQAEQTEKAEGSSGQTGRSQTEGTAMRPQRGQAQSGGTAAGSSNTAQRPERGGASGARGNLNMDWLYLLGLEEE